MAIYDIDFNGLADNLQPPDKRLPKFRVFVHALLGGMKYNRDDFQLYRNGVPYPYYDPDVTYNIGDRVVYVGRTWSATFNGSGGNTPGEDTSWLLLPVNPIGSNERSRYNSQRLILEFALNKRYNTTFNQPQDGHSDIYIVTNTAQLLSFAIGGTEENSGAIYLDHSVGSIVNQTYQSAPQFTIKVPTATFNTIMASSFIDLKNFVDQYAIAGITYNYVTY